jgi:hypothetical protein
MGNSHIRYTDRSFNNFRGVNICKTVFLDGSVLFYVEDVIYGGEPGDFDSTPYMSVEECHQVILNRIEAELF